ncbi:MAG: hypothetical protein CTY12_03080 [Methylotenera sp.]|nr:MAG: hypothetical protein CTY12_03080 [Methylotenera sp.]
MLCRFLLATSFLSLSINLQAQESAIPLDLIELLGEFDAEDADPIKEAVAKVGTNPQKNKPSVKQAGQAKTTSAEVRK